MKSLWAFELPLTTMTTPEIGMPAGTAFVLCYRSNVTCFLENKTEGGILHFTKAPKREKKN